MFTALLCLVAVLTVVVSGIVTTRTINELR
jgi:hypothetical protein